MSSPRGGLSSASGASSAKKLAQSIAATLVAEEQGDELGAGLGDQGDAFARRDAARDQAMGCGERVLAQFGIGIDADQGGAGVVKVHAQPAVRDIIERFRHRLEVGVAARQVEIVGGRGNERLACCLRGGAALAVMIKHVWLNPSSRARRPKLEFSLRS
jgi:hypothetical protein